MKESNEASRVRLGKSCMTAYQTRFGQGFFHCNPNGRSFAKILVPAASLPLTAPTVQWLGRLSYADGLAMQEAIVARHLAGETAGTILLLEHEPVFTIGRTADRSSLGDLSTLPAPLVEIGRGGKATWHGPGQLVGYPILNLNHYRPDLHWYLRQLEEVVIRTVAHYGLSGVRLEGLTGVWIDGFKVAAIGIKVSRWITMHGFALNVCPDMEGFGRIVPCGIVGRPVGSLDQWIPGITVAQVRPIVMQAFEQVFGIRLIVPDTEMDPNLQS